MIRKIKNVIQNLKQYEAVTNNLLEQFSLHNTYKIGNNKIYKIHVKQLNGAEVYVRSNTSDTMVLMDVFTEGYHLPNTEIKSEHPVILDLGCNVGYTTADFACRYKNAKVIAVEMSEENYNACKLNIPNNNGQVKFINAAIWKNNGHIEYMVGVNAQSNTIGLIENTDNKNIKRNVQSITVDAILKGNHIEFVDYLKMDIEGAEIDVLFDSDCEWLNKIGAIKIEVHKDEYISRTIDLLKEKGFISTKDSKHPFCVYGYK